MRAILSVLRNWLEPAGQHPFYEMALLLALACILGFMGLWLRQPLIVIFIGLGVLAGPSGLDIVKAQESYALLAQMGISILLFIVGLKLDVRVIRNVGRVALLTGLGQVAFTSFFGFLIGLALGFSALHSFYIAVALTFSSTIIIVKLLSDKKEIDTLHGQIAIGFLIVQDIVVILMMIVLSALKKGQNLAWQQGLIETILSGSVLLMITLISMRWIWPPLLRLLARSVELLTLFALSWALFMAALGKFLNFSSEVGAFLAGMSLASSDFKDSISSRLVSLRDFLLLFFFINLGAGLNLAALGSQTSAAITFSLFVLIGNPLIVMAIMGVMGYRKRTGFLAGLTVAQISEFSLIFAEMGKDVGHLDEEAVGLITLVGLITIGLSTYLILYSHPIYNRLAPFLGIFERQARRIAEETMPSEKGRYDIILVGLGRFGGKLAQMLDAHPEIRYLGVDLDPDIVRRMRQKGRQILYGDIDDPELPEYVPFESASMVVVTVPDVELSRKLADRLKERGFCGKILLTAITERDKESLRGWPEDDILQPHQMAAVQFYTKFLKDLRPGLALQNL